MNFLEFDQHSAWHVIPLESPTYYKVGIWYGTEEQIDHQFNCNCCSHIGWIGRKEPIDKHIARKLTQLSGCNCNENPTQVNVVLAKLGLQATSIVEGLITLNDGTFIATPNCD